MVLKKTTFLFLIAILGSLRDMDFFFWGGGHGLLVLKVPGSSNFKYRGNKEKDPCTPKMPDIQVTPEDLNEYLNNDTETVFPRESGHDGNFSVRWQGK